MSRSSDAPWIPRQLLRAWMASRRSTAPLSALLSEGPPRWLWYLLATTRNVPVDAPLLEQVRAHYPVDLVLLAEHLRITPEARLRLVRWGMEEWRKGAGRATLEEEGEEVLVLPFWEHAEHGRQLFTHLLAHPGGIPSPLCEEILSLLTPQSRVKGGAEEDLNLWVAALLMRPEVPEAVRREAQRRLGPGPLASTLLLTEADLPGERVREVVRQGVEHAGQAPLGFRALLAGAALSSPARLADPELRRLLAQSEHEPTLVRLFAEATEAEEVRLLFGALAKLIPSRALQLLEEEATRLEAALRPPDLLPLLAHPSASARLTALRLFSRLSSR